MLLMVGVVVFFIMITTGNNADSNQKTGSVLSGPNDSDDEAEESEHNTTPDMEFNVSDVPKDGLPSEKSFSDDLHHMTHQKVKADRKWGHLEITDERIEDMLEIAEESSYEYKDFYIDTLEAWENGDFEDTVEVHNTIWNANNGTVGRAHRLMDEREEYEYIQKHLR